MKITHPPISHNDERGSIVDVIGTNASTSVTHITQKANAIRGNHYHLVSIEHIYVLSGCLIASALLIDDMDAKVTTAVLYPGDLLCNLPGEAHALEATVDSCFISITCGPKHQGDTYPLAVSSRRA